MKTCRNINIIVQTTGGDESYLNGKIEIPNNILANITKDLLLNSSHKEELWCFAYQYAIWLSSRTENIFRGDVPYFLWHGTITSYKNIKIWGVRVYIINVKDTRNKLEDRHHSGYFMGYEAMKGVIIYWKPDQHFLSTDTIIFGFMNIILASP